MPLHRPAINVSLKNPSDDGIPHIFLSFCLILIVRVARNVVTANQLFIPNNNERIKITTFFRPKHLKMQELL